MPLHCSQCLYTSNKLTLRNVLDGSSTVGMLPRRLWVYLLQRAGVDVESKWSAVTTKEVRAIAREVTACTLQVTGNILCTFDLYE